MKLAIVTGLYPPHGGGAERATALLAAGFRDLGHEVHVVTIGKESGAASRESGETVHEIQAHGAMLPDVLALPFVSRALWNTRDLLDRRMSRRAFEAVRAIAPALVVSANVKGMGGSLPRYLARLPAPHVHVAHDFEPIEPVLLLAGERGDRFHNFLWSLFSRMRWGSPELVVFPSEWLRALLTKRGIFPRSKKVVLRNPIEKTVVGSQWSVGRPFDHSTIRLLFLGALEPHKGPLWFTERLRAIVGIDWRLDVVGEGSERRALTQIADVDPRIRVFGRLEGADLEERWREADVLVVPSRCEENAPLVVAEASVRRIPVLAAKVGGVPESVIPGETGWLYEPDDEASFLSMLRAAAARAALQWKKVPVSPTPESYAAAILKHCQYPNTNPQPPLVCPSCRGPLTDDGCPPCKRTFAFAPGILGLLPDGMSAFKKEEALYHDEVTEDATEVHQLHAYRNRRYHERIVRLLRPVAPDQWILELAGGSGSDGALALRAGLRVIETDISPGAVAVARRTLLAEDRSGSRSLCAVADAEHLPIADASLAGAFMTASLHHAEDPRAALREVHRVLAPGAAFVAAIEPHRSYFGIVNAMKPLLELLLGKRETMSVADEEHSGFWRGELATLFRETGFQDVRVEPVWFLAGFLHYTLEFLTRLLGRKKRLRVPEPIERAIVAFDELVFRIPGGRYLAWHWTAVGRKEGSAGVRE